MSKQILEEGLKKLGLGGDSQKLSLLIRYIEEIELFNPAYGLVKVENRQDLIVKHILDSLAPIKILEGLLGRAASAPAIFAPATPGAALRVADIGSGAGLPGIPLAICMGGNSAPALEFTLVERMGRRFGFLQNTLALLALPHVKAEEADIEELALKPEWADHFNLIVFRAFKSLEPGLLKMLLKLLTPGGHIAAYKGRRDVVEKEMTGLNAAWEILPLDIPFLDEERHLVIIPQALASFGFN